MQAYNSGEKNDRDGFLLSFIALLENFVVNSNGVSIHDISLQFPTKPKTTIRGRLYELMRYGKIERYKYDQFTIFRKPTICRHRRKRVECNSCKIYIKHNVIERLMDNE